MKCLCGAEIVSLESTGNGKGVINYIRSKNKKTIRLLPYRQKKILIIKVRISHIIRQTIQTTGPVRERCFYCGRSFADKKGMILDKRKQKYPVNRYRIK